MRIPLRIKIHADTDELYVALTSVEGFADALIANEQVREIARAFGLDLLKSEIVKHGAPTQRAVCWPEVDFDRQVFTCWEREPGRDPVLTSEHAAVGPAQIFNGDRARAWRQGGGQAVETDCSVWELSKNGRVVKTLFITMKPRRTVSENNIAE